MKRKIEKRNYLFLAAFLLITISFVQGVYAASISSDINSFIDGIVEIMNPFSSKLLGDTVTGDMLFAKVLFFIVVLAMVWLALSQIPFFNPDEGAQLWVIWVVAIAVSILAVRFIGDSEWIQTIILPYTTLGIVLAAGFPFVIYFILIELMLSGPRYKTIRRVAWIFFAVVFIGLFVSRSEEVGSARNIYFATAIIALIVSFMDGTFQKMVHNFALDRMNARNPARQIVLEQIARNDDLLSKGLISIKEHTRMKKDLGKRLLQLNK